MSRSSGYRAYVPRNVYDELQNIKKEENLSTNADSFRKMAEYSRKGREYEKMKTKKFLEFLISGK